MAANGQMFALTHLSLIVHQNSERHIGNEYSHRIPCTTLMKFKHIEHQTEPSYFAAMDSNSMHFAIEEEAFINFGAL